MTAGAQTRNLTRRSGPPGGPGLRANRLPQPTGGAPPEDDAARRSHRVGLVGARGHWVTQDHQRAVPGVGHRDKVDDVLLRHRGEVAARRLRHRRQSPSLPWQLVGQLSGDGGQRRRPPRTGRGDGPGRRLRQLHLPGNRLTGNRLPGNGLTGHRRTAEGGTEGRGRCHLSTLPTSTTVRVDCSTQRGEQQSAGRAALGHQLLDHLADGEHPWGHVVVLPVPLAR